MELFKTRNFNICNTEFVDVASNITGYFVCVVIILSASWSAILLQIIFLSIIMDPGLYGVCINQYSNFCDNWCIWHLLNWLNTLIRVLHVIMRVRVLHVIMSDRLRVLCPVWARTYKPPLASAPAGPSVHKVQAPAQCTPCHVCSVPTISLCTTHWPTYQPVCPAQGRSDADHAHWQVLRLSCQRTERSSAC
jgi:hypothetical protein